MLYTATHWRIYLDIDVLEKWKEAGKLAHDALHFGKKLIEEGKSMLDITEKIENYVYDNGGKLAFPTNLAINNVGAHWTPSTKTTEKFQKGDLVKLDVGVHIDGYIGDNALTVEVGTEKYGKLIDTSREALNAAIEVAGPGINVGMIGYAVQTTIENRGYKPIANLTGHGIKRYNLHSGISVPNVKENGGAILKPGDIIAIEPFVTDGAGRVGGKRNSNIYHVRQVRNIRDEKAAEMIDEIQHKLQISCFKKHGFLSILISQI